MPTAWQWLTANSALPDIPSNTAWDHITNIEGGGFWDGILRDGLDVEVDMSCFDVTVDVDLEVTVDEQPEYTAEIDTHEYVVEVCDGDS